MPAAAVDPVIVRRLAPGDSIQELTTLLHRAYRKQVEMGLRPLAGRQTPDVTQRRTSSGECYVAVLQSGGGGGGGGGSKLVGTVLLQEEEDAALPPWFTNPVVARFSLFAVDPDFQGRGIGAKLLDAIAARSRELGKTELSLSMAEPDAELLQFYLKRGYRLIEHWQWPYTNYRSAILSRTI